MGGRVAHFSGAGNGAKLTRIALDNAGLPCVQKVFKMSIPASSILTCRRITDLSQFLS
jgi:hypothetical protein